ncbi:MAG: response regulator transcription factor [Clostridiales bacterium]|nr:response regulator transcription factor [Clostridiales bacterium]
MSGLKILIVDDESRMRKLLHDYLEASGVQILEAADGQAGLDIFTGVKGIDLVILDVMMPKMDGWQVCREIRKISNVPVIMLTARGEERDELKGFDLGVDEYIAKPFSPKILAARIEALIRRSSGYASVQTIFLGELTIDKDGRKVLVSGKPVELSFKEYELLTYLIDNSGVALSREKILNQVWDYDYYGDTRTIDTHIKKLRQKLGDCGDYIETVRNIGYKFEVPRSGVSE